MTRDLDIIVFGATGFTGKHTIPLLCKFSETNDRRLTWGVAGRSEKKLKEFLRQCEKEARISLSDIPVIIANVDDEDSLNAMASKARIIINCCGPYHFYGEPVVKACVEQGTHHVDVTGEPQYMEKMQLKYHKAAQEKGIYIINSCGVDSIPTDLGVTFLQEKFEGTLNSVNTYLHVWEEGETLPGPSINFATWESAIYGLAHVDELKQVRRELHPTKLPSLKPKLQAKKHPHTTDVANGWVLPFLGSDRSVVRRSQRYFYENDKKRPVQIETYFTVDSFAIAIVHIIFGVIISLLARFEFGRTLLLKYPKIFSCGLISREPPSEEKIKNTLFSITLYGEGWKEKLTEAEDRYSGPVDKAVTAVVKGRNPAYGATCVCLVLAAITVITETDKLPSNGGVYPPGYAFAKTSLITQLNDNGVNFEVLSEKNLQISSKY